MYPERKKKCFIRVGFSDFLWWQSWCSRSGKGQRSFSGSQDSTLGNEGRHHIIPLPWNRYPSLRMMYLPDCFEKCFSIFVLVRFSRPQRLINHRIFVVMFIHRVEWRKDMKMGSWLTLFRFGQAYRGQTRITESENIRRAKYPCAKDNEVQLEISASDP